jgi:DNA-directed RNA polymerase subunit RPC12/RpoP
MGDIVYILLNSSSCYMAFKLSNIPRISCPNCEFKGEAKYGRSHALELFLLLFTWPLLLIPLFFYEALTSTWACPRCGYKNIVKE